MTESDLRNIKLWFVYSLYRMSQLLLWMQRSFENRNNNASYQKCLVVIVNNMFISDPTSLNIDDVVSEDSDDNMFNEQKGRCMCTQGAQLELLLKGLYRRCHV